MEKDNNITIIFSQLLNYGIITTKGAEEHLNIKNLKKYICELRRHNIRIISISDPALNTETGAIYVLTGLPCKYKKAEKVIKKNARTIIDLLCVN